MNVHPEYSMLPVTQNSSDKTMEANSSNQGLPVSTPTPKKTASDVNITSRMKNDSQVRALKDRVKGLHGNMNDLEKHLKSLQVSSATKAMIQGVTVNMENHIDFTEAVPS